MITLQSYSILRKLSKHVPDSESPIEILPNCDYFEINLEPDNRVSFKKHSYEIMSIITYLDSHGLVHIDPQNETVFYITHEGFHYRQLASISFIDFLTKSFLVPIVVSVITTLITLLLTTLLPQML